MATSLITLPPYFLDGMVLQQHASVDLRGICPPGRRLHLELICEPPAGRDAPPDDPRYGMVYTDRCDSGPDGAFELFIPALDASYNRYCLVIRLMPEPGAAGEDRSDEPDEVLVIEDILVGEVWVTAGQGNMEMPLFAAAGGAHAGLLDGQQFVRVLVQDAFGLDPEAGRFRYEPQTRLSGAYWTAPADADALRHVSAVTAYCAIELARALRVPIGMIDTALAESMVHTWIDRGTMTADSVYMDMLRARRLWCEPDAWAPNARRSVRQPAVFFNHKIAPLQGMHVRGLIFAQGENEVGDERFFEHGFLLQLKSWSGVFAPVPGSALHVLYTGLPSCCYAEQQADALPRFNLMLARLRRKIEKPAGYVAVQDLNPEWAVSPPSWRSPRYPAYKRELAQRICQIALGLAYHRKLPQTSPEVARVKRVDNKLMLSFRHLEQSLCLRGAETVLKGFSICGEDLVYRPAAAKLLYGVEVMVWHPDIAVPKQVTYACQEMAGNANLCTESNLALAPFSTALDLGVPPVDMEWMHCDALSTWAVPNPAEPETAGQATAAVRAPAVSVDVSGVSGGAAEQRAESERPAVYPGGIAPAAWVSMWRAIPEADIRLKIDRLNRREGAGSIEVSYAGDRADLPILSPQLDCASMRPRLHLRNYHTLQVQIFNPDGRSKDVKLEGTADWQRLEAGLNWQTFTFDLTPLHRAGIDQIRIRILDKMRAGVVLFDDFELKRQLGSPFEYECQAGAPTGVLSGTGSASKIAPADAAASAPVASLSTAAAAGAAIRPATVRMPELTADPPPVPASEEKASAESEEKTEETAEEKTEETSEEKNNGTAEGTAEKKAVPAGAGSPPASDAAAVSDIVPASDAAAAIRSDDRPDPARRSADGAL